MYNRKIRTGARTTLQTVLCLLLIGGSLSYAADNYFTDNVGIGTTSPTERLHINGY